MYSGPGSRNPEQGRMTYFRKCPPLPVALSEWLVAVKQFVALPYDEVVKLREAYEGECQEKEKQKSIRASKTDSHDSIMGLWMAEMYFL